MLNGFQADLFVRRVFLLCLLLSSSICWAFAQNEMSLQQLVQQALQENYQIQVFRNIERIAEHSNTRGNAGMLPTVDLLAEQRKTTKNSRQEFFTGDSQQASNASSNSSSASLEVNWIVFDGLAMFARKDQLEQLAQLSRSDTRFYIEQTVADLSKAYYQLKQELLLLATYRQSLSVSQERLSFEEKAFDIGTSNQLDVELARVDRNTDSSLVLNQQAQVQELVVALNRIINRNLSEPIQPTDEVLLNPGLDLAELMASAKTKNLALSQQQLQELAALTRSEITKGALFPVVSLYGNYDYNRQANEVGFLQSSRTFGPEYGIRLRFNLFAGKQNRIAYENALIDIETEKLRTQDLSLEIEESIRIAYLRWRNHLQQLELERESITAAEEALKIARGQYELGALTNIDFRVIQLNAINAQTRYLEAELAAKNQEIELLRLSGRLLEGVF